MQVLPRVSVILPCYNGAETLAVQLEALARQTYGGPWELVFVDNGSTDGSLDILETFRARLPELHIVNAWSGQGPRRPVLFSYALGFAAATGDVYVTAESDDEADAGYVAAMAQALGAHPFVAAALDYQKLNPPEFCWGEAGQQTASEGLPAFAGPTFLPFASGCALGLTREACRRIGPPSPDCEASWDVDYCWHAHLVGVPLAFAPEAVMHYRLRTDARARYRQGKAYGLGHASLGAKYGQSGLRFTAYWLLQSIVALANLATGLIPGKRSVAYRAWDVGFAAGSVRRIPAMLFGRRKPAPQPATPERLSAGVIEPAGESGAAIAPNAS